MAESMIAQRIMSIAGFSNRFKWLPSDNMEDNVQRLSSYLRGFAPTAFREACRLDAQDKDPLFIAKWLLAQKLSDGPVRVVWLSERVGILVSLRDFLDFLDELWYPSSDDIVVESQSGGFVIGIDHEEQVLLFLPDSH